MLSSSPFDYARGTFSVSDLERLWRIDSPPRAPSGSSRARVHVCRTSDDDWRQDAIHVELDGKLLGTLTYGNRMTHSVAPGHHTIAVSNTFVARTLTISVESGRDVHVECGTGAPRRRWLALLLPFLRRRVWACRK